MKCLHFKSSVVHPNFSLCSLQPEVGREIVFAEMVYSQKVNRIGLASASPAFTNYPIDSFMLPASLIGKQQFRCKDGIKQQYAATLLKVQTL